ncbi:adhesion G-protein coupled receptor G6 isoform X2 [Danio rerio]|uniref:Adhesion G-protein coupled receptor G6 isoform X2 n=1 Tax=Danio rerio TaxID=7955 RepID=A0AC58I3U8_DANRE
MISFISGRWWRWKFQNTLAVFLLLICLSTSVAQSCQSSTSCNVVLTDSQGSFTSPCYPNDYPPSQSCNWTIQAPAGFIVQITFLDFELEEAQGCIYDRVVVKTGTSDAKFCGLTANGLTLNSTGNVMEVFFNSDFSVQKKGFHISYKQVAVTLRNQKVTMPKSSKTILRVSNSISIPVLTAFTVCFEIARTAQKATETIFTLSDAAGTSILAFEKTSNGMELFIGASYCSVDNLLTSSDITATMKPLCLTWTKSSGLIGVYFGGHYFSSICSASQIYTLQSGGLLQIAGKGSSSVSVDDQNLDGFIYNFRLWDHAMLSSELSALTCDTVGNVVDWDHSYWTIPGSSTQTDSTLSCSTAITTLSPGTAGCASGLGCPATLTVTITSIATTNIIPTNATTHAGAEKERAAFLWSLLRFTPHAETPSTSSPPARPLVAPAPRGPKTSLGFISTPLIWPVRKKVEAAVTRPHKRPVIHLTKPPSQPTISMTNESHWLKTSTMTSVAKKTDSTSMRPAYSQVKPPWQPDAHNQTEDFESFQVASLSNRKNKPIAPQVVVSDSDKNLTEILDYPSGFGPEAFFYDIDLDDDVFSLFDFDSTYSLDESLAPATPHNMSFLEIESVPTVNTTSFAPVRQAVSKQEHLESHSDLSLPWAMSELAQVSERLETDSSWTLIPSSSMSPGVTGVQMIQSELKSLPGQTAAPPEWSPTHLVDIKLTSTVAWGLSKETATKDTVKDVQHDQKKSTMVTHGKMESLTKGYGRTNLSETDYSLTDTTPFLFSSASQQSSFDYLPNQTILLIEPLAASPLTPQGSYTLTTETLVISSLSPSHSVEPVAELLMDSTHSAATLIEPQSSMPTEGVQSDFLMTQAIRPSPLSSLPHTDVFPSLTPGSAQILFISDPKNNTDLVLPSMNNQFILSENPQVVHSSQFPNSRVFTLYPSIAGGISTSVDGSWSKSESPLALEPSLIHRLPETLFRGLSRQGDVNPSEVDLRDLSHMPHISVNASSELPNSSAVALTDEQRGSQSWPVNSDAQTKAERINISPSLPSLNILDSVRGMVTSTWSANTTADRESSQISSTEIFPSHFLNSIRNHRPDEASPYETKFRYQSETIDISNFIEPGNVFPSRSKEKVYHDRFIISSAYTRISSTTHKYIEATPTTWPLKTTLNIPDVSKSFKKKQISNTIQDYELFKINMHTIEPFHTQPHLQITMTYADLSSHTPPNTPLHQFHTSISSMPSVLEWTASISVFQPSKSIHISSGYSEDLLDAKHVHSSTTKWPFWAKNESANPSSHSHNVLVVQPATTDTKTHPTPAIDDQPFVPTNGTAATPANGVIPSFGSVHAGATNGTTTDPHELAPCPCKAPFHITCLCGLSAGNKDIFYRSTLVVTDEQTPDRDATAIISQWLNQTFQNWMYRVYVDGISLQLITVLSRITTTRQIYLALLVYKNTTDVNLAEVEIESMLRSAPAIGNGLTLDSVTVNLMENCQADEFPVHYRWPESRPTVTQYVPCFPYKDRNASRTCMINRDNYTSFWALPDRGNCTNITSITVSQENAMDVAVQLADISNNGLSKEELTQVVTKVMELVNIAKINATLASTVVTIISNVMVSSEDAQKDASETALKAVDELVQKIEFDGPSLTISSKNLVVGVSALDTTNFNGSTLSAFIATNTTDPQIDFDSEAHNALAVVTLPPTLLQNLSLSQIEKVSRINFMFFGRTGLFQDHQNNGLTLNSYVVASSVGNFTIKNLQDPVRIEIAHLEYQKDPNPQCVFWDFNLQNYSGGWNSDGCKVGSDSNSNRTVCLCNHLTHFGILMDVSRAAELIDEKNNRVLTFITYIGCGISAIFSAATLLTYIAFEKLRRDYPSKILMNLSTSLLFLNMVFLLDGWLASYEIKELCVTVAVFLHFFLLTSFTWMGLESIHMYIALVKVFNTYIRRYILKFCIVGWGVPATIVAIVLAVSKDSYGKNYYGKGKDGQGTSEFCWILNPVVFYVTCVAYFSIIFLMNVAMFIVVMIQICGRNGKRSNRTLREDILRNLRSVVSLTFLLGMTWGFAFFAWGPVSLAFMYLFTIFNSLQGLFIFVFHCALKENVQKQWRRYLCCGKLRLADNSDWSKTATNNTKKVSSDNLGKSLSSSSFGSTTANWTSKAKATLNPFARHSNAGKSSSNQSSPKCSPSDGEPSSSILPVHQVLDKVKGYCSVRSDNFYKNIIMSDSFSNSTKF